MGVVYYYMTIEYIINDIIVPTVTVGSTNGEQLLNSVAITYEEYCIAMNALNIRDILWIDTNGKLHNRKLLTKYDEINDTWITDDEAVTKDIKQKELDRQGLLKINAKLCLLDTEYLMTKDTFDELSPEEQLPLIPYRKYLRYIMNVNTSLADITELKTIKEF